MTSGQSQPIESVEINPLIKVLSERASRIHESLALDAGFSYQEEMARRGMAQGYRHVVALLRALRDGTTTLEKEESHSR